MESLESLFINVIKQLNVIYDYNEAKTIAHYIFDDVFNVVSRHHIISYNKHIEKKHIDLINTYLKRLFNHEPVQYILQKAYWSKYILEVDTNVLIPRPETEYLISEIIPQYINKTQFTLLDIGTGSGCIPIALQEKYPQAKIISIDKSLQAINIAKRNALQYHLPQIIFSQIDIFDDNVIHNINQYTSSSLFNYIVSNPPYIPQSEYNEIENNVKNFEPHEALFVNDTDSILFYKKIITLSQKLLHPQGKIFFECHKNYALSVQQYALQHFNADALLLNDLEGNNRFVIVIFK